MKEVDSVSASDFLDDGTELVLQITIDRSSGSALFDFTGRQQGIIIIIENISIQINKYMNLFHSNGSLFLKVSVELKLNNIFTCLLD